jgi:hypothetical protein
LRSLALNRILALKNRPADKGRSHSSGLTLNLVLRICSECCTGCALTCGGCCGCILEPAPSHMQKGRDVHGQRHDAARLIAAPTPTPQPPGDPAAAPWLLCGSAIAAEPLCLRPAWNPSRCPPAPRGCRRRAGAGPCPMSRGRSPSCPTSRLQWAANGPLGVRRHTLWQEDGCEVTPIGKALNADGADRSLSNLLTRSRALDAWQWNRNRHAMPDTSTGAPQCACQAAYP